MFSIKFTKASIVDNICLNTDWFLVKTPFLSKKSIMRFWSNFSKILREKNKNKKHCGYYIDGYDRKTSFLKKVKIFI